MKKRFSSRLISILLLIALLSSCGEGAATADTTTADTSAAETTAAETKEVPNLPDKDWGGKQFRVLGYTSSITQFANFEIDSDGENGDVVNDAIYRRNTAIEEKYNVEIVQTLDGSDGNGQSATTPVIRRTVLANEDAYDLVFAPLGSIGTIIREQMLYDLNSVEHIDLNKPWWNQTARKDLEIDGKLFADASDFSLRDKNRVYIMTVNLDIIDEFKLSHPVELVRAGTWTLDAFNEYAAKVAGDLNGNSEVDHEDRFGYGVDSGNGFAALVYGGDVYMLANEKGKLVPNPDHEHTVDSIEKVLQTYSQKNIAYIPTDWNRSESENNAISSEILYSGRVLFRTLFPHSLQAISANSDINYSVVPMPKFDEKQEEYVSRADPYGMLFGIPVTTATPDFSGFMLEALSYESTETSLRAYYEVSCKTKYTYDEDSAEMLDLIFDSIRYEPALAYNITGKDLIASIGFSRENHFASEFAALESAMLADLDKLLEDINK